MKSLFVNSFEDSKAVLVEDCPAGDESLELTNLDQEDFRVLQMLVAIESYRVSCALGGLVAWAYARGLRDARRKVIRS